MTQPSLLDVVQTQDKPRKRVRQVSSEGYAVVRDEEEKREQQCLRVLAAYRNRFQVWPTLKELTRWAYETGQIQADDPNIFRPRATKLVDTRGVCVYGTKRICRISGAKASPIQIVEIGADRDHGREL